MFSLLLKFLLTRSAKLALAHISICLFLFLSWILLLFLVLACLHAAPVFSDIYLVETRNSNTTLTRTGYFHMCSKAQQNSTFSCASLGGFKHDGGLAYTFAKHVSRPYFCALSLAVTLLCLMFAVARVFVEQVNAIFLPCLGVALLFSMVSAVWQQVAVQAATHLIPDNVLRGNRAGALVWTSFAFLILTLILDVAVIQRKSPDDAYDDLTSKNGESSIMSTIYKVGDGVHGL